MNTPRCKKNRFARKATIVVATFPLLFVLGASIAYAQTDPSTTATGPTLGGLLASGVNGLLGWLLDLVGWLLFKFAAWGLTITGSLFDAAMGFSLDSENFKLTGVETGWKVLRDFANITFIFILLYIGIATILQFANFNTKRMLATLVIVALLVNFSFFFSGIVIDAANILSLNFYNEIAPVTDNANCNPPPPAGSVCRKSPTGQIAASLELANMVNPQTLNNLSWTQKGIAHLLGAAVLGATAFAFLSGAVLFILRTVALMFVLMLSPIAFAAAILPATRPHWNRWLHALTHYSFVAPIYLLMFWIIIEVVQNKELIGLSGSSGWSIASNWKDETYDVREVAKLFLNYIVVLGLIMGAFTLARNMAGSLATISVRWSGRIVAGGIGLAARPISAVGRRTIGKNAHEMAQNKNLQDRAAAGDRTARLQLAAAQRLAKSSFDIRGGATGKALGALGTGAGAISGTRVDFAGRPTAGRGGYERMAEERERETRRRAESAIREEPITHEDRQGAEREADLETHRSSLKRAQAELREVQEENRRNPSDESGNRVRQATQNVESLQIALNNATAGVEAALKAIRKRREAEAGQRGKQIAEALERRGGRGISAQAAAGLAERLRRILAETPEETRQREREEREGRLTDLLERTGVQLEGFERGGGRHTPRREPESGGGEGGENA